MTSPRCAACWGVFPAATTRGATARCQPARGPINRRSRRSYRPCPKPADLRCAARPCGAARSRGALRAGSGSAAHAHGRARKRVPTLSTPADMHDDAGSRRCLKRRIWSVGRLSPTGRTGSGSRTSRTCGRGPTDCTLRMVLDAFSPKIVAGRPCRRLWGRR